MSRIFTTSIALALFALVQTGCETRVTERTTQDGRTVQKETEVTKPDGTVIRREVTKPVVPDDTKTEIEGPNRKITIEKKEKSADEKPVIIP